MSVSRLLAMIVALPLLAQCQRSAPQSPIQGTARVQGSDLSPSVPTDIPADATQEDVNAFAWQSFVALNWPALAGSRGSPDPDKIIGQPGAVVWETWKTPGEIFYPDFHPNVDRTDRARRSSWPGPRRSPPEATTPRSGPRSRRWEAP